MAHRYPWSQKLYAIYGAKAKSGLTLFKSGDNRLDKSKGESWQFLCKSTVSDAGMALEARKPLSRRGNV